MIRRIALVAVVLLVALGGAAWWKRTEVARLMAVNTLFDADRIVANFSAMDTMFLTRPLPRGDGPVSPLPQGPRAALPPEVGAWVQDRAVTAMLVMKDGAVVAEDYYRGTGAGDRRISWSVAKSWLSALFGILHAEGTIPDLDAPVTRHAPALAGTAYDGATIRNVLTMASGVAFDEDYLDFWSDINAMGRTLALGGSMDGFAAGLTARAAPPGTQWQYVSIDTHVLGMVIRGATGRDVVDLMAERVVQPLGLEADPTYVTDGNGVAFVLGGLNVTTRDYARFGQMIADGGRWNGRQIVPEAWIEASTRASAPGGAAYGFQWWLPADARPGEFFARGIYGQYIYIDRPARVVIVVNAASLGFAEPGVEEADIAVFRRIAASL